LSSLCELFQQFSAVCLAVALQSLFAWCKPVLKKKKKKKKTQLSNVNTKCAFPEISLGFGSCK